MITMDQLDFIVDPPTPPADLDELATHLSALVSVFLSTERSDVGIETACVVRNVCPELTVSNLINFIHDDISVYSMVYFVSGVPAFVVKKESGYEVDRGDVSIVNAEQCAKIFVHCMTAIADVVKENIRISPDVGSLDYLSLDDHMSCINGWSFVNDPAICWGFCGMVQKFKSYYLDFDGTIKQVVSVGACFGTHQDQRLSAPIEAMFADGSRAVVDAARIAMGMSKSADVDKLEKYAERVANSDHWAVSKISSSIVEVLQRLKGDIYCSSGFIQFDTKENAAKFAESFSGGSNTVLTRASLRPYGDQIKNYSLVWDPKSNLTDRKEAVFS